MDLSKLRNKHGQVGKSENVRSHTLSPQCLSCRWHYSSSPRTARSRAIRTTMCRRRQGAPYCPSPGPQYLVFCREAALHTMTASMTELKTGSEDAKSKFRRRGLALPRLIGTRHRNIQPHGAFLHSLDQR